MMQLLSIKDCLEIIFFSIFVYTFCLWLKKDKASNLLMYFFGYIGIFCLAFLLNFTSIVAFLIYSAPPIMTLFIIFHQEVLQRNFITPAHIPTTSITESSDWIEQLIRASLHAMNNNKQFICVIENRSDLKPFLYTPFLFDTLITQNIITFIVDSLAFDHKKIIWCDANGKLRGVNSEWQLSSHEIWQKSVTALPAWKQDALLITLKTDTLIYKADPAKRIFDIIIKGTIYENIPAHQAITLIKKHILTPLDKGEPSYEYINQKRTFHEHKP